MEDIAAKTDSIFRGIAFRKKRVALWKKYLFNKKIKAMLLRILDFSEDAYPEISDIDEDYVDEDYYPHWSEVPECEEYRVLVVIEKTTLEPTGTIEYWYNWQGTHDTMKV